jgi:transcriptional regulator
MYTPAAFCETRPEALRELMRRHPLAALVATTTDGLTANHLPLVFDPASGPFGALRGHVARANPVWRLVPSGSPVLAIFQGPDHYVTPSWYPGKTAHGMVVPTWNYAVVHAHGTVAWHEDAGWLRGFLDTLTSANEAHRAEPWQISDAPERYIERQLGSIVGLEIAITTLTGKWKLGQNRDAEDRSGIAAGLAAEGTGEAGRMLDLLGGPIGPGV